MRKSMSLLLVLAAVLLPVVYAAGANLPSEVPALVRAHVEGMETVKPALFGIFKHVECHDVWDILDKTREDNLTVENIPGLIAALEKMNAAAAAAAARVNPLLSSPEEPVKTAADRIKDAYEQLINANGAAASQLRAFQQKPGTAEDLQKISTKVEFDVSDFTSNLYHASAWVVDALEKAYPDKQHSGYPKKERAQMVKRLAAIYGENKNKEAGISLTEGVHFRNAVVFLYEVLQAQKKTP